MSMAVTANENVIMQPQIQLGDPHLQLGDPDDNYITMIVMNAILLIELSLCIIHLCVNYGGWFWKLLAIAGPLSVVNVLCIVKYVCYIEQYAKERNWRWALSLIQLAIGAAYPASMYMSNDTKQLTAGWVVFGIFFLQAAMISLGSPKRKNFGDKAVHPLPPESAGPVGPVSSQVYVASLAILGMRK